VDFPSKTTFNAGNVWNLVMPTMRLTNVPNMKMAGLLHRGLTLRGAHVVDPALIQAHGGKQALAVLFSSEQTKAQHG
jgi:hypothetical protein